MRAPSAFAYVRETEIHSNDGLYRECVPRRENRTRKEFLGPEQLARTQQRMIPAQFFFAARMTQRASKTSLPAVFTHAPESRSTFLFSLRRAFPGEWKCHTTPPQRTRSHRATEPARVSQRSEPERPHFPLLPGAPTAAAAAARSREFAGARPPAHPPQLALGNPI